jgi:hypothetical protein
VEDEGDEGQGAMNFELIPAPTTYHLYA